MSKYTFIVTLEKNGVIEQIEAIASTEHSRTIAMYSAGLRAREYFEPLGYTYLGIEEEQK